MEIKDTCHDKCKFWKKYKDNCPNYIETTWIANEGGQLKLIKDCAPKRSLLVSMDVSNRLMALQKEVNTEREMHNRTSSLLAETIELAQRGMIQVISPIKQKVAALDEVL